MNLTWSVHAVEVDSSQNCASLQMYQFVAVGVLKKCDLRSGQTQKSTKTDGKFKVAIF